MNEVFLSVGGRLRPDQEEFVRAVEDELRRNGVSPRTVGRNSFTSGQPLARIREVMDECAGAVVLALERTHSPEVTEYRGAPQERTFGPVALPTVWNQIEAAMAYSRGLPLLVVVEHGMRPEGLLEGRYDWYVQEVAVSRDCLNDPEFRGVLSDWLRRVEATPAAPAEHSSRDLEHLTLGQVLRIASVTQLWAVVAAAATILAGVAAVAYAIGQAAGAP